MFTARESVIDDLPAIALGPVPMRAFMGLELTPGALAGSGGRLIYPPPFNELPA